MKLHKSDVVNLKQKQRFPDVFETASIQSVLFSFHCTLNILENMTKRKQEFQYGL